MPTPQENFHALLANFLQEDQADLDFGIYKILNLRRKAFLEYAERDLYPQIAADLGVLTAEEREALSEELKRTENTIRGYGMNPADSPAVQKLRARLEGRTGGDALANEIFSDLYDFFRRYYDKGDFLALPRYKAGVYAIPYEGEEVKLHWANADQYYIKSSENFRDYTFTLSDQRRVHFKLRDADTETDNNRAVNGSERRFILAPEPVSEIDGELVIGFAYRHDGEKRKQDALNAIAVQTILAAPAAQPWRDALATPMPTPGNGARTLLAVKLKDYTDRNTFDYFIHKDLEKFLRRELDFYIKNEVMRLDDIDRQDGAEAVEQSIIRIKVIRRVAHKVIAMLAQVEEFQKALWLKKKFVVNAGWCVTLDRVPESLYPAIAANDMQRADWVKLFRIDEIAPSTVAPGYSAPLSVEFLHANPYLALDTKFFDAAFTDALLESPAFDDLDGQTDGILINSDNFQALNLLQERYRGQVKCIYIDPPYNTGGDGFLYKDSYQHSSWLTMMENRLTSCRALLPSDGAIFISIDDDEQASLKRLLDEIFGSGNFINNIIWQKKYSPQNDAKWFSDDHDFLLTYARDKEIWRPERLARTAAQDSVYTNPDNDPKGAWMSGDYTSNKSADERPNLWYVIINPNTKQEIWPQSHSVWRYTREQHVKNVADNRVWWGKTGANTMPRFKRYLSDVNDVVPRTIWPYDEVGHNQDAVRELRDMLPDVSFASPKPTALIRRVIQINPAQITMDFFAGSGTTGHAVIAMNREDGGQRKYVLVEMGDYFESVLKPRIQKAIYSKDWKDGKPLSRAGVSHCFKYLKLESYEDTYKNLLVTRAPEVQSVLDESRQMREEYTLRYLLPMETQGSPALLNFDALDDPMRYTLKVANGSVGQERTVNVDLIETFNYLLGVRVKRRRTGEGIRTVEGALPDGRSVLILWRVIAETDNARLDEWFTRGGYGAAGYAVIYVNGDNTLRNTRAEGQTWTVELIEGEFLSRMVPPMTPMGGI